MIKKQGDKWLCDIQPGGRGHVRYRKVFRIKAEAKRFELFVEQKFQLDDSFQYKANDKRVLQDFVKLWFDNTGQFLSSGKDSYQRMIHASSVMGSPIIRLFKPVIFLGYRSQRIEKGVSSATLNRELQTFKAVFNDLIASGQFECKNPFSTIRQIKTHQPKTTYLSTEEIKKLFSYLDKSDSDAYMIALICLSTGARWGESQSLTLSDLANKMVHFHQTKSKKSRSVLISDVLYNQLQVRLKLSNFTDAYSTFTRRLFESGIELPRGQRTHVLRHTFASHYVINGGSILALQRILGHASLNMTMKYSHLAPDFMKEILEKNPSLSLG
jgi:integrase